MANNFEGKSFQTAVAARGGKPLRFQLESMAYDDTNPEAFGELVAVELIVDPRLDVVRLGAMFGQFGATLQSFSTPGMESDEKMRLLDVETPRARDKLRDCLVPPSRVKFDLVKDTLDIATLGEVVRWLTQELTGMDPTQGQLSSDGSPLTGSSSTPGALLTPSTSTG